MFMTAICIAHLMITGSFEFAKRKDQLMIPLESQDDFPSVVQKQMSLEIVRNSIFALILAYICATVWYNLNIFFYKWQSDNKFFQSQANVIQGLRK